MSITVEYTPTVNKLIFVTTGYFENGRLYSNNDTTGYIAQ